MCLNELNLCLVRRNPVVKGLNLCVGPKESVFGTPFVLFEGEE
jgi:hypothetical protein